MKFSEYQELSRRTMDNRESDTGKRKLIATLGLVGEAGEISRLIFDHHFRGIQPEKLAEEMGDFWFYVAFLCHLYGFTIEDCLFAGWRESGVVREFGDLPNKHTKIFTRALRYSMDLMCVVADLADVVKKEVGHNHPLNEDSVKFLLGKSIFHMTGISILYDLDMDKVAEGNVEKLKRRYPDGFSSQASIDRSEND